MKIVVLDGYTENPGDLSWDELGKLGELTVYDRTPSTMKRRLFAALETPRWYSPIKPPSARRSLTPARE